MVDYKQTDVGLIPVDWEVKKLEMVANFSNGKAHELFINENGGYIVVNSKFISTQGKVVKYSYKNFHPLKTGDITMVMSDIPNGKALAKCYLIPKENKYALNQRICSIRVTNCNNIFLSYLLNRNKYYLSFDSGTGQTNLKKQDVVSCPIPLPPLPEQESIAEVLSDTDALIIALEKRIAKKRLIKQGAMQKLLTPQDDWEVKKLGEVCDVLDNLRVPLNDTQRKQMKGEIPYCGANGVVDYVNDFVVDDNIILMAEDGGYFDEYKTRPIAYKMSGKCWVNNHAHILKSKKWICQDFIYYSIVHKNILDFIIGGTRAKLNKSDLISIEINIPKLISEQTRIATILSDMDSEIEGLEKKLTKAKELKQGLMQQLLTGKIRLV